MFRFSQRGLGRSASSVFLFLILSVFVFTGCGDDPAPTDSSGTDSSVTDAPEPDATVTDASEPDATVTDASEPDATVTDASGGEFSCGALTCTAGQYCSTFSPGQPPPDGGSGTQYSCVDAPSACAAVTCACLNAEGACDQQEGYECMEMNGGVFCSLNAP